MSGAGQPQPGMTTHLASIAAALQTVSKHITTPTAAAAGSSMTTHLASIATTLESVSKHVAMTTTSPPPWKEQTRLRKVGRAVTTAKPALAVLFSAGIAIAPTVFTSLHVAREESKFIRVRGEARREHIAGHFSQEIAYAHGLVEDTKAVKDGHAMVVLNTVDAVPVYRNVVYFITRLFNGGRCHADVDLEAWLAHAHYHAGSANMKLYNFAKAREHFQHSLQHSTHIERGVVIGVPTSVWERMWAWWKRTPGTDIARDELIRAEQLRVQIRICDSWTMESEYSVSEHQFTTSDDVQASWALARRWNNEGVVAIGRGNLQLALKRFAGAREVANEVVQTLLQTVTEVTDKLDRFSKHDAKQLAQQCAPVDVLLNLPRTANVGGATAEFRLEMFERLRLLQRKTWTARLNIMEALVLAFEHGINVKLPEVEVVAVDHSGKPKSSAVPAADWRDAAINSGTAAPIHIGLPKTVKFRPQGATARLQAVAAGAQPTTRNATILELLDDELSAVLEATSRDWLPRVGKEHSKYFQSERAVFRGQLAPRFIAHVLLALSTRTVGESNTTRKEVMQSMCAKLQELADMERAPPVLRGFYAFVVAKARLALDEPGETEEALRSLDESIQYFSDSAATLTARDRGRFADACVLRAQLIQEHAGWTWWWRGDRARALLLVEVANDQLQSTMPSTTTGGVLARLNEKQHPFAVRSKLPPRRETRGASAVLGQVHHASGRKATMQRSEDVVTPEQIGASMLLDGDVEGEDDDSSDDEAPRVTLTGGDTVADKKLKAWWDIVDAACDKAADLQETETAKQFVRKPKQLQW